MKRILLALITVLVFSLNANSQAITFCVTGVKNAYGKIRLAFFASEKEYKDEKPKIERYINKKDIKNGKITIKFEDIPVGTYGVCLLDDENNNGKMDYSFFIPQEGFGFSNYYHDGLSKPKFENFKFKLDSADDNKIQIKVRYM